MCCLIKNLKQKKKIEKNDFSLFLIKTKKKLISINHNKSDGLTVKLNNKRIKNKFI